MLCSKLGIGSSFLDTIMNSAFLVIPEKHFSYEIAIYRETIIRSRRRINPMLERTAVANFQKLLATERMHDRLPAHMLVRTYICISMWCVKNIAYVTRFSCDGQVIHIPRPRTDRTPFWHLDWRRILYAYTALSKSSLSEATERCHN